MKFKLQRPQSKFSFKAGKVSPLANHLSFFPIFKNRQAVSIAKQIGKPELRTVIEKHFTLGNFKANVGTLLFLPEAGLVLGGLGSVENWHPEKSCELFYALGRQLSFLKEPSVNIMIDAELAEMIEKYAASEKSFGEQLTLQIGKRSYRKPTSGKTSAGEEGEDEKDEKELPPDYVGPWDLQELVSQIVVSLSSGAESMKTLSSKKSSKSAKIPIGLMVSSLRPGLLPQAIKRGEQLADALNGARYLASLPGNYLTPETYAGYSRSLAKEFSLNIRIYDLPALKKMGCGGIVSVGSGSAVPPKMIVLEYNPSNAKTASPLVLVGKGITFDTGGISIKPSAQMHEMKFDMCGSALVLHAIALAAARQLPLHLVAVLGIAENMPDGYAIKPGDVYTAYNGKTVEVQNTDAEGRLVLGDLLAYAADKYDPLCILDFATLTGACVVALGHDASALMTASEDLAARIDKASRRSLDRLWRMPHWSVYGTELMSDIADLRNIGAGRAAGTISAMRFLSHFLPDSIPWAHFDIAGTAWRSKGRGTQGKGATGWGIRLLDCFMEELTN